MATIQLLSIIESATHPNLSAVYKKLGINETKLQSMRKALAALKSESFDFIVAEFFYGYGSNYAGVNISNLDVMLYSLQKYAPNTRVIVLVDKSELPYVDKLKAIFPLYAVLPYPVSEQDIQEAVTI
jgi:NADH:ubiquinone oxidoreductase subunit C